MQPHAIQMLPRPCIKRETRFEPGEVVVSKASGSRVRVERTDGDIFVGEFIGYRNQIERPEQHRYRCDCWLVDRFEREPRS